MITSTSFLSPLCARFHSSQSQHSYRSSNPFIVSALNPLSQTSLQNPHSTSLAPKGSLANHEIHFLWKGNAGFDWSGLNLTLLVKSESQVPFIDSSRIKGVCLCGCVGEHLPRSESEHRKSGATQPQPQPQGSRTQPFTRVVTKHLGLYIFRRELLTFGPQICSISVSGNPLTPPSPLYQTSNPAVNPISSTFRIIQQPAGPGHQHLSLGQVQWPVWVPACFPAARHPFRPRQPR